MPSVDIEAGVIHYETAGPQDGRPVVFVHGYGMGGSLWRELGARLGERGLRCIAPTWPLGAHTEPMRAAMEMTLPGVAAVVRDVLTALELDDVVLVGNDTGGVVAQLLAGERPTRVGALVLTSCDAFEHFPPPVLKPLIAASRSRAAFRAAVGALRSRVVRRRSYGPLSHHDIDPLVREWIAPALGDPDVTEDLRRLTGSMRQSTTIQAGEQLHEFDRPALVAWSADDAFFPVEDGRRLTAALPDARFELIDGARTFSMIDRPDRLAELIGEFARAV